LGVIIHIDNVVNWKIKKKMKGKDLINGLPDDVKFRWHLGVNEFGDKTDNIGYKEYLLQKTWTSLKELLMASFSWGDTSEGVKYWMSVSDTDSLKPVRVIKQYEFV